MKSKVGSMFLLPLTGATVLVFLPAICSVADDSSKHMAMGIALQQTGQDKDGIPEFRTAIHLNPNNAEAQEELSNALANANDVRHGKVTYGGEPTKAQLEEAIYHLRIAVHLQPENPDWQSALGIFLANSGRYREGIYHDRRAIALLPPVAPMTFAQVGSVVVRTRARENARAIFQWHVRERAMRLFDFQGTLADAMLKSGQSRDAIPIFRAHYHLNRTHFGCLPGWQMHSTTAESAGKPVRHGKK